MGTLPQSYMQLGDTFYEGQKRVFFVVVFGKLKETGKSVRTGEPIMHRSSRTWGWFGTFEDAVEVIEKNISDIWECFYEYAMIDEVPEGICTFPRQEWWWKWEGDDKTGKYIPTTRPEDFKQVVGMSVG